MKKLLSYSALALTLAFTMSACKRAEPPAPTSSEAGSAISLQKIDTVVGTGKEATAGSTAVVNYTGWLYEPKAESQHGAKFDSSVGRSPFSFRVDGGQVIKGWDVGVQGMKVGGKRTIIVPAEMGYGSNGIGPIPPNANLIFDVELLDVQ
ncbi:MAG TPA: FKBP-type peptidyl-prolyl cis-trans isomerase [Pseudoduganella sp.]